MCLQKYCKKRRFLKTIVSIKKHSLCSAALWDLPWVCCSRYIIWNQYWSSFFFLGRVYAADVFVRPETTNIRGHHLVKQYLLSVSTSVLAFSIARLTIFCLLSFQSKYVCDIQWRRERQISSCCLAKRCKQKHYSIFTGQICVFKTNFSMYAKPAALLNRRVRKGVSVRSSKLPNNESVQRKYFRSSLC